METWFWIRKPAVCGPCWLPARGEHGLRLPHSYSPAKCLKAILCNVHTSNATKTSGVSLFNSLRQYFFSASPLVTTGRDFFFPLEKSPGHLLLALRSQSFVQANTQNYSQYRKDTRPVSVTNLIWVYSENHMKPVNTLCGLCGKLIVTWLKWQ